MWNETAGSSLHKSYFVPLYDKLCVCGMAPRRYVHSSETLTFCGGALSNFFMSAANEVSHLQSCNVSVTSSSS